MPSLDLKQLQQLGARTEIARLASAIHDLLDTFPNFRALPELQFLARRPGRPPAQADPFGPAAIHAEATKQIRRKKAKKRVISAAHRAAISAAQKARWATKHTAEAKGRKG